MKSEKKGINQDSKLVLFALKIMSNKSNYNQEYAREIRELNERTMPVSEYESEVKRIAEKYGI